MLINILDSDGIREVRLAAINQMTDQSLIITIIESSREEEAKRAAIEKLTDPQSIIKFARNIRDDRARLDFLRNITDENVLVAVLSSNDGHEIQSSIVFLMDTIDNANTAALHRLYRRTRRDDILRIIRDREAAA